MASQSRRQRRAIAKQMGYLGRNETVSDLLQRTRRSGDFGKQLHTLHLEKVMNDTNRTIQNIYLENGYGAKSLFCTNFTILTI
jgi:AraC-like DNA-binding protein